MEPSGPLCFRIEIKYHQCFNAFKSGLNFLPQFGSFSLFIYGASWSEINFHSFIQNTVNTTRQDSIGLQQGIMALQVRKCNAMLSRAYLCVSQAFSFAFWQHYFVSGLFFHNGVSKVFVVENFMLKQHILRCDRQCMTKVQQSQLYVRYNGVTINRIGPHRTHTGPHRARTGPEMTDCFASTTNLKAMSNLRNAKRETAKG